MLQSISTGAAEFIRALVITGLITALFATGFVSYIIKRSALIANLKNVGIKRVYKKAFEIKNLDNAMAEASEIMILSCAASGLAYDKKQLITQKLNDGAKLKFLLANPESELARELGDLEGGGLKLIGTKQDLTRYYLQSARAGAKDGTGTLELEFFSTEYRNIIIICKKEETVRAWLTVVIPPVLAIHSNMIEYEEPRSKECLNYFNMLWEKYSATREMIG